MTSNACPSGTSATCANNGDCSCSTLRPAGSACKRNSECASDICTCAGYCGKMPAGAKCAKNIDCQSGDCYNKTWPHWTFDCVGTCQPS